MKVARKSGKLAENSRDVIIANLKLLKIAEGNQTGAEKETLLLLSSAAMLKLSERKRSL